MKMGRRNRVKAKLRMIGDPILKTVCKPVSENENVSGIIRDMMYILTNNKNGVGLAANQAGHTKRIIIVSFSGFYKIMINPVIIAKTGTLNNVVEQCLSYPKMKRIVQRHSEICVEFYDEKYILQGKMFDEMQAYVIQHEIDHLDGKI